MALGFHITRIFFGKYIAYIKKFDINRINDKLNIDIIVFITNCLDLCSEWETTISKTWGKDFENNIFLLQSETLIDNKIYSIRKTFNWYIISRYNIYIHLEEFSDFLANFPLTNKPIIVPTIDKIADMPLIILNFSGLQYILAHRIFSFSQLKLFLKDQKNKINLNNIIKDIDSIFIGEYFKEMEFPTNMIEYHRKYINEKISNAAKNMLDLFTFNHNNIEYIKIISELVEVQQITSNLEENIILMKEILSSISKDIYDKNYTLLGNGNVLELTNFIENESQRSAIHMNFIKYAYDQSFKITAINSPQKIYLVFILNENTIAYIRNFATLHLKDLSNVNGIIFILVLSKESMVFVSHFHTEVQIFEKKIKDKYIKSYWIASKDFKIRKYFIIGAISQFGDALVYISPEVQISKSFLRNCFELTLKSKNVVFQRVNDSEIFNNIFYDHFLFKNSICTYGGDFKDIYDPNSRISIIEIN